jgi:Putative transposase of IS4/5 family (DUF4096)
MPLLPEPRRRKDNRGRPWASNRACFEGILWILQTGAAWQFLPDEFPSPSTCWRRLPLDYAEALLMKHALEFCFESHDRTLLRQVKSNPIACFVLHYKARSQLVAGIYGEVPGQSQSEISSRRHVVAITK